MPVPSRRWSARSIVPSPPSDDDAGVVLVDDLDAAAGRDRAEAIRASP
jgi:hypothetical protein